MDHLRRLIWFVVGVALAFVLVPSFAQNYEYTGKVPGTTGGVAKQTLHQCTWNNSYWPTQKGAPNADLYQSCSDLVLSQTNECGRRGGAYGSATIGFQYTNGWYWFECNNAQYIGGTNGWYQFNTGGTPGDVTVQSCPSGTVENSSDHLCYALQCPSVSPSDPNQNAWQQDPNDSNQCRRVTACPWAALWSDGTCSCPSSVAQLGVQYGSGRYTVPGNVLPGGTVCLGGCNVKAGESTGMTTSGVTVSVITVAGSSAPSSFCSPPPSPTPTDKTADQTSDAMASCLQGGGSWGTVNGAGTCLPKGSGGTTTKYGTPTTSTETKTNPDGTTSTTTTTSTPVTTCTGGVCTTTTTTSSTVVTKDANGNVTGTTTTGGTSTGPGGGGGGSGTGGGTDSSGFGGACSAGFSCDGDAVVCAIALEQHKRDCQLWDPGPAQNGPSTSDAIGYYNAIGSMSAGALSSSSGAISAPDQSTFIGGQGSLQDLTITVVGKQIAVPLSTLNSVLQTIGMINVAVASVACVAIYRGGMG